MMRSGRPALVGTITLVGTLALLVLASPLSAQRRQQSLGPATAHFYKSNGFELQLTTDLFQSSELLFDYGWRWALGDLHWLPRVGLAAGIVTGTNFLDGLAASPRVSLERAIALPLALRGGGHGDLTIGAAATAHATWRFAGDEERGTFFEPAVRGIVGYRMDRGGGGVTFIDFQVEGRADHAGPILYLRVGQDSPRR